jgi:hypothetical protein
MPLPELELLLYHSTILADTTFPLPAIGRLRQVSKWHASALASPIRWKRVDDRGEFTAVHVSGSVPNVAYSLTNIRWVSLTLQSLGWPRFGGASIVDPIFAIHHGASSYHIMSTEQRVNGDTYILLSVDSMRKHVFIRLSATAGNYAEITLVDAAGDTEWEAHMILAASAIPFHNLVRLADAIEWSALNTDFRQCIRVVANATKSLLAQYGLPYSDLWCEMRHPGQLSAHRCELDDCMTSVQ